jgi:hypothetical protein
MYGPEKYATMQTPECLWFRLMRKLTHLRSLYDKFESGHSYGEVKQFDTYRLSRGSNHDRHSMCCVVHHSIVERCASFSLVHYDFTPDWCSSARRAIQADTEQDSFSHSFSSLAASASHPRPGTVVG